MATTRTEKITANKDLVIRSQMFFFFILLNFSRTSFLYSLRCSFLKLYQAGSLAAGFATGSSGWTIGSFYAALSISILIKIITLKMKSLAIALLATISAAQITDLEEIRAHLDKSALTCSSSIRLYNAAWKLT